MKIIIALALVVVASGRPNEEFYSSRYDNFDVTQLTENPRLMKSYTQCFLGKGKCTPEGTDISKWMPDALNSNCGKCTDTQKGLIAQVIKALMEDHAEDWEELRNKYDPEHKHDEEIKVFLEKHLA